MDRILYILSKVSQREWLSQEAPQTFLKHLGCHRFMTARQQNDPHIWIEALEFIEDEVARHWGEPVVQQHRINLSPSLLVNLDGFISAGSGNNSVAIAFQHLREESQKSLLIVDSKNTMLLRTSTATHTTHE